MTRIFIETLHNNTSEYVFMQSLLNLLGLKNYELITVGGKDNLENMVVQFEENTLVGGKNIIVFDADRPETGGGYERTMNDLLNKTSEMNVSLDGIFLFPNNHDDGIFEDLLDHLARKDLHQKFFDCFSDYEKCLGDQYLTPNLKGKLHTYISAQKGLSRKQRERLGKGQWMFDQDKFWDLENEYLNPLKEFLKLHVTEA